MSRSQISTSSKVADAMDISADLQNELAQFQQLQEQFQLFSTQRAQMEIQLREIDATLEKLGTVDDSTPLYQSIGSVLLKVDGKKTLTDDLTENKETITRRINSMKEQEDRLKQRLESMGKELNAKLQNSGLA